MISKNKLKIEFTKHRHCVARRDALLCVSGNTGYFK